MPHKIDPNKCIACHACMSVCPVMAISIRNDGTGKCIIDPAVCIDCATCASVCPVAAIARDIPAAAAPAAPKTTAPAPAAPKKN